MAKPARRSASTRTLLTKYGYDKEPWADMDGKHYATQEDALGSQTHPGYARYAPRPNKIPFDRPNRTRLNTLLQDFRTELEKSPDTPLEVLRDYSIWRRAARLDARSDDREFAERVLKRYRRLLESLVPNEEVRANAPAVARLVSRNPSRNDPKYMSSSELMEFVKELTKTSWSPGGYVK